jgi:hypothetical protein
VLATIKLLRSKRFWLHVPNGLIVALFVVRFPILGVLWFVGFMVYEIWQCYREKDQAHKDIAGLLGGMAIGGVLAILGLF